MILQRVCVLFCSACFIVHSIVNIYKNFADVKTVDYTHNVELSNMKFPLSIQVFVDPGNFLFCNIFKTRNCLKV